MEWWRYVTGWRSSRFLLSDFYRKTTTLCQGDAVFMNTFKRALPENLEAIQHFLKENKLRTSIVINEQSIYFYIQNEGRIIGTIGAELNGHCALIRAAGVSPEYRRQRVANRLFDRLVQELELNGVTYLYLFSRQAADFWSNMGFSKCEIQEVIDVLSNTPQVQEFLKDNSIWTDVAWFRKL